jgi:hypothetical protein
VSVVVELSVCLGVVVSRDSVAGMAFAQFAQGRTQDLGTAQILDNEGERGEQLSLLARHVYIREQRPDVGMVSEKPLIE